MNDKKTLLKQTRIPATADSNKIIVLDNQVLESQIFDKIDAKIWVENNKIFANINIPAGLKLKKPIHICFAALHKKVTQDINMNINLAKNSEATFLSDCVLTSDKEIRHIMNSSITLGEGASYTYLEKHIHNNSSGVYLNPSSKVKLAKNSSFKVDFELLEGRIGQTVFDYDIWADQNATIEIESRLKAFSDDKVVLKESVVLAGKGSKALLKSRVAALDNSQIEIFNTIIAKAADTRGHIDCQEILMGKGRVKAYPNAEVSNPTARVTHEASLGGLDNKKMETLMARAKSEKEAQEILLQGILSKNNS